MKKLFAVVVLALTCTGCSDPYGACVKTANVIANSVGAAMNDMPALVQDGFISKEEATEILGYLNTANTLDGQFESCVSIVHSARGKANGYLACANTYANALKDPTLLSGLQVKNPKAQAKVRAYVDALQLALTILSANLSGQQYVPYVAPTPFAQSPFIYDPRIIASHPVWVNPCEQTGRIVACSTPTVAQ